MKFKRLLISGNAVVVAFDMCSSSDMLEELILRNDIRPYNYVIGEIKHYLARTQETVVFDPYKFTGDGWILLFPAQTNGSALWNMLTGLSAFYRAVAGEHLLPRLNTRPTITGLTFGIEVGPIAKTTIFQQTEYVGRSITVACRLQSAVKSTTDNPAFRALISSTAYLEYLAGIPGVGGVARNVPLRNIRGGRSFRCKLLRTLPNGLRAASEAANAIAP